MTGKTRRSSSSKRYGIGERPGGFTADVQDVGAGRHQGPGLGQGRGMVEEAAAVGKGVGGDVEHPHDQRARRRQKRPPRPDGAQNLPEAGERRRARHGYACWSVEWGRDFRGFRGFFRVLERV